VGTAFGAKAPETSPHWPRLNWTRVLCPRRLPLCSPFPPHSRTQTLLPSKDSSACCLHPSLQRVCLQILITSALAGDEYGGKAALGGRKICNEVRAIVFWHQHDRPAPTLSKSLA
jgi:hypothetical protein